MIKPQSISGFYENLPEAQIIEDRFKDIIKKNYNLSGFVSLDTPNIERVDVLTSKGADDNEIYGIKRLKAEGEEKENFEMGLRFDLTVPLARYIAQYEGELTFPFKRQQIGRVYRGERPQKGRYREFYQADVDIIGNGKLPLFADVEVISTTFNALKELDFGDFVINLNNRKLLEGFIDSIIGGSSDDFDFKAIVNIIDKTYKIGIDSTIKLLDSIGLNNKQIEKILEFIKFSEEKTSKEILDYFSTMDNELIQIGIKELEYVYDNLLSLGVEEKYIKINPAIARGLGYYTGTVFETFIFGAESMGSIASGGRYENLAENFTKNNFPGVGGSIGLSRLIAVLNELGKIELEAKTVSQVMLVNMGENLLTNNLQIVNKLRKKGINVEIFLDPDTKIQKQLKYADNKKIPFVIIIGEEEIKKGIVQLKDLRNGTQREVKNQDLINEEFNN